MQAAAIARQHTPTGQLGATSGRMAPWVVSCWTGFTYSHVTAIIRHCRQDVRSGYVTLRYATLLARAANPHQFVLNLGS